MTFTFFYEISQLCSDKNAHLFSSLFGLSVAGHSDWPKSVNGIFVSFNILKKLIFLTKQEKCQLYFTDNVVMSN